MTNPALDAVVPVAAGRELHRQRRASAEEFRARLRRRRTALHADWSLTAKFDGEFAAGSQTYAGTGTLRYTW